jgi:hypothetical protein
MQTVLDQRRRLQHANVKHETKLQLGVIRSSVSNQVTEILDLDIQHVFDRSRVVRFSLIIYMKHYPPPQVEREIT